MDRTRKVMKDKTPIAVTSRSFSRHPILRSELLDKYSDVRFNDEGMTLQGQQLIDFALNRRKLITALETIDEAFLVAVPDLKVIIPTVIADAADYQSLLDSMPADRVMICELTAPESILKDRVTAREPNAY